MDGRTDGRTKSPHSTGLRPLLGLLPKKGYDTQIRKMLNMYRVFELKSDIDRLYLPREMGGRGLISVWDSFQASTSRIAHALINTDNPILQQCISTEKKSLYSNQSRATKYESKALIELPQNFLDKHSMSQARIKAGLMKQAISKAREQAYLDKPQHGAFIRLLKESGADLKLSMAWLRCCYIDPNTESYLCGAQELALFTKYHEKHILKNSNDDLCRVCKKNPETIFHILGACDALAKREYFTRYNNICKYVHFKILKHYNIDVGENWFRHNPAEVVSKNKIEIIYDQIILTTRPVGANRPDILIKDLENKKAYIIHLARGPSRIVLFCFPFPILPLSPLLPFSILPTPPPVLSRPCFTL